MSKIRTYKDLLREEQRLIQQLRSHEQLIKQDIAGVKEGLQPINNFLKTVKKLFTRDYSMPFTNAGINFAVDLIFKKFILAKAGWLTRTFIPYVVKNYSSHIVNEEAREKIAKKLQQFFNKIRPKKDKPPKEEDFYTKN